MTVEIGKTGYRDLNLSGGISLYATANQDGMTFSQFLEKEDPTRNYPTGSIEASMDAFERQMYRFGLRTKSDVKNGVFASKVEDFFKVAPENAKLSATNQTNSQTTLFPEFVNRVARQSLLAADVVNELVGIRTPIDSDAYRSFYVTENEAASQKRRVVQGTDMPRTTIAGSEHTINLTKKGRIIDCSYEFLRRMRIDMLQIHLDRIMKQAALDLASDGVKILVSGDGNSNTAATNTNVSAAGGASGAISYTAWNYFRSLFYPDTPTTAIVDRDQLLLLLGIDFPTVDPMTLLALLQQNSGLQAGNISFAQNIFGGLRVVFLPDNTDITNKVLMFDKQYGLELINEIGSDITETQNLITTQFKEIVLSQVVGWATFIPHARTLTTNA